MSLKQFLFIPQKIEVTINCENIMFQSKVAVGNSDPQITLSEENKVRKCKTTLTCLNTGLEIRVNQPVNPVMKVNRFAALLRKLDRAKV